MHTGVSHPSDSAESILMCWWSSSGSRVAPWCTLGVRSSQASPWAVGSDGGRVVERGGTGSCFCAAGCNGNGSGDPDGGGGSPVRLLVVLVAVPHPGFKRNGSALKCTIGCTGGAFCRLETLVSSLHCFGGGGGGGCGAVQVNAVLSSQLALATCCSWHADSAGLSRTPSVHGSLSSVLLF